MALDLSFKNLADAAANTRATDERPLLIPLSHIDTSRAAAALL